MPKMSIGMQGLMTKSIIILMFRQGKMQGIIFENKESSSPVEDQRTKTCKGVLCIK